MKPIDYVRGSLSAAKLFWHVFTTDAGCIPQYQQQLGHDRVFALPFAAQPAIHNRVQSEPRDGSVCFAGTYYGSRHTARQVDMEHILGPAIPFGLEIYGRQHGVNGKGEDYAFPEVYQICIKGRLDYDEMVKAYERYRVFLNVNSVKHFIDDVFAPHIRTARMRHARDQHLFRGDCGTAGRRYCFHLRYGSRHAATHRAFARRRAAAGSRFGSGRPQGTRGTHLSPPAARSVRAGGADFTKSVGPADLDHRPRQLNVVLSRLLKAAGL